MSYLDLVIPPLFSYLAQKRKKPIFLMNSFQCKVVVRLRLDYTPLIKPAESLNWATPDRLVSTIIVMVAASIVL